MKSVIKVTTEELDQAVENLVYFIINSQNLNPNVEIDEKAIAQRLLRRPRSASFADRVSYQTASRK